MERTTFDVFEQLEQTAGSNAKRELLELEHGNELLRRAFVAAQDPYVVYYVKKFRMPVARRTSACDDVALQAFLVLLEKLAARQLTGNSAKDAVEEFFGTLTAKQQKWCQRILLRNLRCGVQTTVNKVWPGLIRSFNVALAATLKSNFEPGVGITLLEPVQYPVRVEPKLDGLRLIAMKNHGVVTLYTRNGTIIETLPTIQRLLERAPYDDLVLDGEAMGASWNESNSVLMSSKSRKDDSSIVYHVFDAVPIVDWIAQETVMLYDARAELVERIVKLCAAQDPKAGLAGRVRQVPHVMALNEAQLRSVFKSCMDQGYEGVMLKKLDVPYEWDRSRNILKLKPCVTYEGAVVGWYAGRDNTARAGQFGGFEVLLPNGIITRVGGGFNDVLRAKIQLEDPNSWMGRIVECEAQPDPLTQDGLTEDGRMRFPVFIRARDASDVDPKIVAAYAQWVSRAERK